MSDKPETKRKYVVTAPHVQVVLKGSVESVGAVVLLTDAKAAQLVNKVRLQDEVLAEEGAPAAAEEQAAKDVETIKGLEEQAAKDVETIKGLETANSQLNATVVQLSKSAKSK